MRISCLFTRCLIACCLLALCSGKTPAAPDDPLDNRGWVHFYNLEYDRAQTDFHRQILAHPADPSTYNALAQSILYGEMYRDGALESQMVSGNNPFLRRPKMEVSPNVSLEFGKAVEKALDLCQAKLAQNPDDVSALYQTAVAHGLRANYLFLVEKAWMQALHEAVAGRKANDRVLKLDQSFKEAHLIEGMVEYVVSCLPRYLRVLGSFNGFHGNKEDGIRQLEFVSESDAANRFDAAILLVAVYRREHRPKDALPLLKSLSGVFPRNYLLRLEQVQMYSDSGDKASALRVLAQLDDQRRNGVPGYNTILPGKLQFAKGNLLFWYGDLAEARTELKQATAQSEQLDLSTAVMAWFRLGQVCDLTGDRSSAEEAYRETIKMAPKSEVALEAKSYIDKPYRRKHTDDDKT